MTSATERATPGGTILAAVTYTYDVLNNRIQQVETGGATTTTTRFVYDRAGNAWADLDGSNNLVTRRLYLNAVDELLARTSA